MCHMPSDGTWSRPCICFIITRITMTSWGLYQRLGEDFSFLCARLLFQEFPSSRLCSRKSFLEFKSTVFRIQGLSTQLVALNPGTTAGHYKLMVQPKAHSGHDQCHACGHFNNQNRNVMMVLGSHWHGPTATPPSVFDHVLLCMCLHPSHSCWHATTAAPPSGLHQLLHCMWQHS